MTFCVSHFPIEKMSGFFLLTDFPRGRCAHLDNFPKCSPGLSFLRTRFSYYFNRILGDYLTSQSTLLHNQIKLRSDFYVYNQSFSIPFLEHSISSLHFSKSFVFMWHDDRIGNLCISLLSVH